MGGGECYSTLQKGLHPTQGDLVLFVLGLVLMGDVAEGYVHYLEPGGLQGDRFKGNHFGRSFLVS